MALAIEGKTNRQEAHVKRTLRRQLDLTRTEGFEQGDLCFLFTYHDYTVELKHRFGIGWKCRCQEIGLEIVIPSEAAHEEIKSQLIAKIDQVTAKPKSIWDILTDLIDNDQITVAPLKEQVIWEGNGSSVSIFRRTSDYLVLVARNGKQTTSKPVAHWGRDDNHISGARGCWKILKYDGERNYREWAKKARKG